MILCSGMADVDPTWRDRRGESVPALLEYLTSISRGAPRYIHSHITSTSEHNTYDKYASSWTASKCSDFHFGERDQHTI